MENSGVKSEYFMNAFEFNEYPKAFCKSSHYSIYKFSQLTGNVKYKFSDEYDKFTAPHYANEWYGGKGFVHSLGEYPGSEEVMTESVTFLSENIDYLKKIITFCKEKNICRKLSFDPQGFADGNYKIEIVRMRIFICIQKLSTDNKVRWELILRFF